MKYRIFAHLISTFMRLSLVILFFISFQSICQVTLVYPNNNHVQSESQVFFQWNSIPGIGQYTLEISPDALFSSINSITVSSTDTVINVLPGEYYWRIQDFDMNTSGVRQFTRIDFALLAPHLWVKSDTGVILDFDGHVEEWRDISGNDNHAFQVSSPSRPFFNTSEVEINGKPSLIFDGNDRLNTPNLNSSDVEIFLIAKGNVLENTYLGFGLGYRSNQAGARSMIFLDGDNFKYFGASVVNTNFQQHHFGFLNGSAFNSNAFSRINFAQISAGFTVGGGLFVLNNLDIGSGTLNGEISEIIMFNSYLTEDERETINGYFRSKYAPPVNLGQDISYSLCSHDLHAGERFTSFLWSDGTSGESITVNESGTYWVQVTDIFGFTSSDTIVVTYPEIEQPTNLVFCPGEDIVWNTNLGVNYDYLWSTGETTESITINTEDNYFVTVTDTNGCELISNVLFFEEDLFASIVSLGPDVNLCSGNTIALVSGTAETVSYLWGGGEITPSIVVNTTNTYTVEVENANGCVATDDILVTIVGDAPVVQIGMNPFYCQLEEFVFTDNSFTTDGSNIVLWDWDFGDATGSTDETGSHTYINYGQVTVQLTISTDAGCDNTAELLVDVFQKPIISFSTLNECQSAPIDFYSNQSTLPFIINWDWNFDDPTSGANNTATGEITSHVYETVGDFNVELMAEDVNGCRDTVVQTVSVLPTPQVAFTFDEVCIGQTVSFTNQSTIENPYLISTTQWQLGGGATSSQFSPSRLYVTAGTFDVTLTVIGNNGCVQQLTQPLKIHALPQPNYTFSPSCAGLPTVFTDVSIVPDGNVGFVIWQFNANNPVNGNVVSHAFINPGTQQVRQQVVSDFGCQYTEITNMQSNPFLIADFSTTPDLILGGVPTLFENQSTGADSHEWQIGTYYSGIDESPVITFPLNDVGDTVEVMLIVGNSFGCADTVSREMIIYESLTDLAITQLFVHLNEDGYEIIGAELSNLGSSTITKADLYLKMSESSPIKSTWSGELTAGQKEVYIFPVTPYQFVSTDKENDHYLCVEGQITSPVGLVDGNQLNNEFCRNIAGIEAIMLIPYPNPVSNELTVRVIMPENQTVDIQIFDATGKLVYTIANNEELQKGLNTFTINVSSWAEGSYTIYLHSQEIRKRVRFVKS